MDSQQDFLSHKIGFPFIPGFFVPRNLDGEHMCLPNIQTFAFSNRQVPGPRLTYLRELFLLKIPQKSNFDLYTGMIFTGITVKVNFEICQSSVIDCKQSIL